MAFRSTRSHHAIPEMPPTYEYNKLNKSHTSGLRGPGGKSGRLLHLLLVMLALSNVGLVYYFRHAHGTCCVRICVCVTSRACACIYGIRDWGLGVV